MPIPGNSGLSRRPSLHNPIPPSPVPELYTDSRFLGQQGPSRHVRIPHVASYGGGAIAKNEDGQRCVVAGKESLRILRISEPGSTTTTEHKSVIGRGGYRIDASRNLWMGSGLKIDSSSTDVVWGHGTFSNKILTSARNGELIMWDLNKNGPSKYERRVKEHVRAIHNIAYSTTLQYYCITGSADGYIRVWDLRDMSGAITQIRHPASVRAVVLSPVSWQPLQAVTALENGNIYMWDLQMGQRGQLHRIPLAHSGAILTLDWTLPSSVASVRPKSETGWYGNMGFGQFDDLGSATHPTATAGEAETAGMGWLASGGMDRCVKVWSLSTPPGEAHVPRRPAYTLHTSFPVRRVLWRPGAGYDCELAVVSNVDFGTGPKPGSLPTDSGTGTPQLANEHPTTAGAGGVGAGGEDGEDDAPSEEDKLVQMSLKSGVGDPIELWDVRRGYIAKWTVRGSAVEGGVTDIDFADSHTLWTQHFSGAFSQLDLRFSSRPLDAVPRTAITWDAAGSVAFVAGRHKRWEVPYDDVNPEKKVSSKRKAKTLGDKSFVPSSQTMGMIAGHGLAEDVETFAKLVHGYVFDGSDKTAICSRNAEIASMTGKYSAVQIWQLLASLLTDIIPTEVPTPTRSLSPLPFVSPRLLHSATAPASIPTVTHPGSMTSLPHTMRSASETLYDSISMQHSPGTRSNNDDRMKTHHAASLSISSTGTGYLSPQKHTPTSSTTTSPRRPSSPLPPPPMSSSMVTSAFARRPSSSSAGLPMSLNLGPPPIRRLGSNTVRRTSFSTQSTRSASETQADSRGSNHSSLRHVGEGALDDSDSEGSGDEKVQTQPQPPTQMQLEIPEGDSDEELELDPSTARTSGSRRSSVYRPTVSPYLYPRSSSVQPSPLSQVVGQHTWTEDEKEEEDSPSPASTDSESSSSDEQVGRHSRQLSSSSKFGGSSSRSRKSSLRSGKVKARSRSSTVASLAASVAVSTTSSHGRLMKQESQSSIRTVTATPTPTSMYTPGGFSRDEPNGSGAGPYPVPSTLMGSRMEVGSIRSSSYYSQSRPRSEALSNEVDIDLERRNTDSTITRAAYAAQREAIKETEERLREAGWEAMRETLEVLADEGDVQMCAMLSMIAPDELRINTRRVLRFLESYIDLLMRLRLHTTAAYVRKHSSIDDVRETTSMETTIYTCCGRCRKPLLHPVAKATHAGKPSGSYAFCSSCKASPTLCSICHLPVRALLFQCPVCLHGGHHNCYQEYYLRRPLMELPSPNGHAVSVDARRSTPTTPESKFRGRGMSRSVDGEGSDDGVSSRDGEDGRSRGHEPSGVEARNAILGHPCATGCGHYCWAANEVLLYSGSEPEVRFA